jgi:hypothetical protein
MVVEQIGIQPPAAQKFLSYFKRNRFGLDITRGEVNIRDFPV